MKILPKINFEKTIFQNIGLNIYLSIRQFLDELSLLETTYTYNNSNNAEQNTNQTLR